MKFPNGEYYVEVKDHRYKIHPTENFVLRKRDPPQSLRIQYQVQNETQIWKHQKVIKNDKELIVKIYPKNKQPIKQQPKITPPNCPTCKQKNWLEIDKRYHCKNCENIINKQKHQIDEKFRRQDHYFSTRLPYADKKIRKIWMSMVSTTYISTQDMIIKLQSLKGKRKKNFCTNISKYYDEMKYKNFKFEDYPFSKNAQSISKISQEVSLLTKFSQTKPQVKNMNINYYDLYYAVIKNRDEKENVDETYGKMRMIKIFMKTLLTLIIILEEKTTMTF